MTHEEIQNKFTEAAEKKNLSEASTGILESRSSFQTATTAAISTASLAHILNHW